MTKQEWLSLNVGQTIYSLSGTPRKILTINNGCISFSILRKSWTGNSITTYCPSECRLFTLKPKCTNELLKISKL
jgi:hypothetical protein